MPKRTREDRLLLPSDEETATFRPGSGTSSSKRVRRTADGLELSETGNPGIATPAASTRPGAGEATHTQNGTYATTSASCSSQQDVSTFASTEVGTIERITLKNFMNHSNLDFAFHRRVNFVTGRNGTGKSALLTAVVVGLGGNASSTSRGSRLKGFVKDGKQVAEVTVQLSNRGSDAYEPEKFGESIVVYRKLNVSGANEYQIRSRSNKLISKKREDLDKILDHFNIQVDNPIAVLNQEVSKNFLWSKSAADRYKFFLKATQLDQMKEDHQKASEEKDRTADILRSKEETLPRLQKEVNELETKHKALQYRATNLQELREELAKKEHELLWAMVELKESVLADKEKDVAKKKTGRSKFDQKVGEAKTSLDDALKQRKDIEEEIKKMKSSADVYRQEHESAKRKKDDTGKALREAQARLRDVERQKKDVEQDRDELRKRIDELQSSSQDYVAMKKEREAKIAQLQVDLEALKVERQKKELDVARLRQDSTRLRDQKNDVGNDLRDLKRVKAAAEERIRTMEASKSDSLRKYGYFMPELVRQVQLAVQQCRFHERPRGPLGAHVKLKDPSFALATETALGKGLLTAFCVSDSHDAGELKLIMKKVCTTFRPPMIITTRFENQVYDTRRYRLQSTSYKSVYDVLTIDDPVVTNCLIDQRGIESIVLIYDGPTARQVMKTHPPTNASECYTGKGDQIFPVPNFRVYSQKANSPIFLSHNVDQDIRAEKEKIVELDQQISAKSTEFDCVTREMDSVVQSEKNAQKALQEISQQSSRKNMELADLNNADEELPVDVAVLEEEADRFDQQLRELTSEHDSIRERYTEAKAAADQAQAEQSKAHTALLKVVSDGDPKKEELSRIEQEVDRAKHAWRHYNTKLAEYDKEIEGSEKEIVTAKTSVEEAVQKASAICVRMHVGKSASKLEKDIIATRKSIEKHEEQEGDLNEVAARYNEAFTKYTEMKSNMRQCRRFLEQLDHIIKVRARHYKTLLNMMTMRARLFFTQLLNNRSYTGKMKFTHQQELLEISVNPASSTGAATPANQDMRGLSGGERSFSTLCFILSLWETMESPFRCMDEFDVFMDMVNRHISMQMILQMAEQKKSTQFILLTPQNMSQISITDSVKIFQMPDLVKTQQRLAADRSAARDDEDN